MTGTLLQTLFEEVLMSSLCNIRCLDVQNIDHVDDSVWMFVKSNLSHTKLSYLHATVTVNLKADLSRTLVVNRSRPGGTMKNPIPAGWRLNPKLTSLPEWKISHFKDRIEDGCGDDMTKMEEMIAQNVRIVERRVYEAVLDCSGVKHPDTRPSIADKPLSTTWIISINTVPTL